MQLIAKFETLQFWLSVKWGLSNNRISEIFWQIVFVDSFQQTFVGLQDVFKTCSEMSSTRLQRKTKNWKAKNCYAEDVFKTSWRHILKTSWRHVLKTSSRRLGGKQNVYWGYLYLTNLNVYIFDLSNLYLTNLYLTNLKRIQNALIRTQ